MAEKDPLARWLGGEGLAALDGLLGETVDVVGVIDRQLVTRYVNWTAPGLTREGVIGGDVLELTPPDQREMVRQQYLGVLATGKQARFEMFFSEGPELLVFEVRLGPIRVDGEVVGITAISANITEQRKAHADRDRFFSLSLDMLVVASAEGYFKRVNPALSQALGYEASELCAQPFLEFIHPDDRASTLESFSGLLAREGAKDFENRYRRKDGEYRVFSWRATVDPLNGDVYAVARDITEHRTTELQLRRAQKMEAIGQLAGGVAHDFNNLMQAILGNTELSLEDTPPNSRTAERLTDIQGAARRAADLTRQLLTFSRQRPLRPVAVDLNALVRDLMRLLRRLLPENVCIDLRETLSETHVHADPTQLEQVVVNLCVNARDAMPRGGLLTLETEVVDLDEGFCEGNPWARPGRYALLTVTDTGTGMTPEVQERAFEPFFTTKTDQQGTGLGLSTVYGIVEQHQGLIRVRSRPGEGCAFEIYLPRRKGGEAAVEDRHESAPPRGQETILVAEDEDHVRRTVVEMLQRAGYATLAVRTGLEAVRAVRESTEPIHLALLDVVMPELGGPEAWEQIRELYPELRVLFTSGYADVRHRAPLPPGAQVLDKPYRMHQLLCRVRDCLDA